LPIGHRQPIGRWRGLYTLQANIFTRPQWWRSIHTRLRATT
jgi:hypothetical protein